MLDKNRSIVFATTRFGVFKKNHTKRVLGIRISAHFTVLGPGSYREGNLHIKVTYSM